MGLDFLFLANIHWMMENAYRCIPQLQVIDPRKIESDLMKICSVEETLTDLNLNQFLVGKIVYRYTSQNQCGVLVE